jgi:hypothetical protein
MARFTTELQAITDAALAKAEARVAAGGFFMGTASGEIAGQKVSLEIVPNTRNGRGLKNVFAKNWYVNGKRISIAKLVAALTAPGAP